MPVPPSSIAALSGATVLANLSASNITIGKSETRHLLTRAQSARCLAAYVYAAAGAGESTTDLAWDGQVSIDENGVTLARSDRFPLGAHHAIADVDLDLMRQERMRQGTFDDNASRLVGVGLPDDSVHARSAAWRSRPATHASSAFPFVPADPARLAQDCFEAYNIQVAGPRSSGSAAIGVKYGRHRRLGWPRFDACADRHSPAPSTGSAWPTRQDILAYTLPGFATGDETKANAFALMTRARSHRCGKSTSARRRGRCSTISAIPMQSGEQPVYDVTFENVQAGLRTDYLFRLANHNGGDRHRHRRSFGAWRSAGAPMASATR